MERARAAAWGVLGSEAERTHSGGQVRGMQYARVCVSTGQSAGGSEHGEHIRGQRVAICLQNGWEGKRTKECSGVQGLCEAWHEERNARPDSSARTEKAAGQKRGWYRDTEAAVKLFQEAQSRDAMR